jgi:hypothetical protein
MENDFWKMSFVCVYFMTQTSAGNYNNAKTKWLVFVRLDQRFATRLMVNVTLEWHPTIGSVVFWERRRNKAKLIDFLWLWIFLKCVVSPPISYVWIGKCWFGYFNPSRGNGGGD